MERAGPLRTGNFIYREFEILSSRKTKLRRLASLLLPFFIGMQISRRTKNLTLSAVIAALYTALTLLSYAFGLDKGVIQLRLSEALAVLPAVSGAAVPGLFVGCFLSSMICGGHPLDVLFGSLVTLLAALLCRMMHKVMRFRFGLLLIPLPNILLNAFLIPLVLIFVYGVPDAYSYLVLTVGIGELVTTGVLGTLLLTTLRRRKDLF